MSTNERIRGRPLQRIRARVLRAHPLCVRCLAKGRITVAIHVDHILAVTNGGSDDPYDDSNRQGLCGPCHLDKTQEDMGWKPIQTIGVDGYPVDEMEGE